ncbi:MAG: hypothetical protein ABR879_08395 [Methanomassiliicoccales archaeon]|jgi:hypothetical protein
MAEHSSASRGAEKCDVKGCGKDAERSVSGEAAREAGLDVEDDLRRAHLCKDHYKQFKKATKEERQMEYLGR